MTARLTMRDQEYEPIHGMAVQHALETIDIPPESVIATRNDELLTEDELLREGETECQPTRQIWKVYQF